MAKKKQVKEKKTEPVSEPIAEKVGTDAKTDTQKTETEVEASAPSETGSSSPSPLDEVFNNFQKTKSEFVPEPVEEPVKTEEGKTGPLPTSTGVIKDEEKIKLETELKKRVLMKIVNLVFTGANVFIYNMFFAKKGKTAGFTDLSMDEAEQMEVAEFMDNEILKVFEKIPDWFWGLAYMESIYMDKMVILSKTKENEK